MIGNVRAQGEMIRCFILKNIEAHASDIAAVTAAQFGITRQAVNKHLFRLRAQGDIVKEGSARVPFYRLAPLSKTTLHYPLANHPAEDVIWVQDIKPAIAPLPDNVLNIWHHGFTEMFNNAVDHSLGTCITVEIVKTASSTEILIADNGIGIFRKIQQEFSLLDERHAILELSKGKLTTDPKNHSGEGIFFTSRMFDKFDILSGGLYFSHEKGKPEDWLSERDVTDAGTAVFMELNNHTALTTRKVFDEFSSNDDLAFDKTIVPVTLAKYGDDELISRSQAKRLLARVDLFKIVIFDFDGVGSIGQAFADQIFRVFADDHPDIALYTANASQDVQDMIGRVKGGRRDA
ncbi:STAS-like domain-containing protein [Cupriavidus pauculus]|uniref:STAS-like domain-containing protein n=1 Tax=Cupriavidus pauculus TaxID=82633 RepID=UPI001EE32FF0|nr:DUF4325 domain-containing protein [Cupriavidus pauculus]GJG97906.1 DUF4325 domain-containing protein [Cupriavidus pauculus]